MLSTNKSQSSKQDKDNFKIYAVIAAAGLSKRFGSEYPKQFISLDGYSSIRKSVDLFLSNSDINGVVCVIPEGYYKDYLEIFRDVADLRLFTPVIGGDSRKDSIRQGLETLIDYHPDFVLIHDAARPYCDPQIIEDVISALKNGAKAVVPAVESIDSVRLNGKSVNRSDIKLIQTPQGFDFRTILGLHNKYRDLSVSDDAALCDLENIPVQLIEGDINNKKITYKSDIHTCFKTGFGYDAHRFSTNPNRKLILMGCEIPNFIGLDGVSDADVGIHSLVDAILGALGEGSIGEHFPDNDPKNRNADSKTFLIYCKDLINKKKSIIINIDTTIICELPNISQFSKTMKKIISNCLNINENCINIKGKTTEGMGFEGRKEGISAYSIVTLESHII